MDEKIIRRNLLLYTGITAVSFTYLVMPERAALGIPVFAAIQLLLLWFTVPERKKLWRFIPIFILSCQPFISGNGMWRIPNFIVCLFLYAALFLDYDRNDLSIRFLGRIFERLVVPFQYFAVPFQWLGSLHKGKTALLKRILLALVITVPCAIILILILSSADMVFSEQADIFIENCFGYINVNVVLKCAAGVVAALYLFGIVFAARFKKMETPHVPKTKRHDFLIMNIFLAAILIIYTCFVVVQFRYLFAHGALPYGLSRTEYARRGFFELLFLTAVNIVIILLMVYFKKDGSGIGKRITTVLCCYLCAVTIVLLVSSFYRMYLYSADDGLTRMRFMVFGFLIFEALGLLITFAYIIRPKFNIVAIYLLLALTYYLVLNVIPMDRIIAKSQVDRYFSGSPAGIAYTMTLSSDAADAISRLLAPRPGDDVVKQQAEEYFENLKAKNDELPRRWQRFNLSLKHAEQYNGG